MNWSDCVPISMTKAVYYFYCFLYCDEHFRVGMINIDIVYRRHFSFLECVFIHVKVLTL